MKDPHPLGPRGAGPARTIVELLLSNHPDDCLYCVRNNNVVSSRTLAAEHWACAQRRYFGGLKSEPHDRPRPSPVARPRPRQVRPLRQVRARVRGGPGASPRSTSSDAAAQARVGPAFDQGLNLSSCINCAASASWSAPPGALTEQTATSSMCHGRASTIRDKYGGHPARAGGVGHAGRGVRAARPGRTSPGR
ncbi:MAG: hypothetical protein AB2L07_14570 [Thermoanaerobaculaceae bacterium]